MLTVVASQGDLEGGRLLVQLTGHAGYTRGAKGGQHVLQGRTGTRAAVRVFAAHTLLSTPPKAAWVQTCTHLDEDAGLHHACL